MKKLFLLTAAFATMLFASCQKEEIAPAANGTTVNYTVEIPATPQTRAIQENGENINDLVYAVYQTEAETFEEVSEKGMTLVYQMNPSVTAFDGGVTNVSIELMNDQNYVILFWAQVNDAWVKGTEFDLTEITYPENLSANNADMAAFSGVSFLANVNGATSKKVTLTRPFAQINVGTTLPKNFTVDLTTSDFIVTNAGTAFNVATQEANGKIAEELVFNAANLNNLGTLTVNDKNYTYVAMNYIFAKESVDVEFNIATASHGTVNTVVPNVPVQKNYKTNIVGNLLTSNVSYEITLDNVWGTPEEVVYVWNGSELNEPKLSANDSNIYEIEYPSELAWLAAAVNGTLPETRAVAANDFAGKTFVLNKDIDLGNFEWTPIGSSNNIFKGTFDGNGHTVKNLNITGYNSNVGLFGVTHDGEIKNLIVENAKVSGRLNVGVVAGQPYTSKYTNITVKGHVEVNGMAYVGGVGGKNAYADWTRISVNVDETSYVKANSVENGTAYRTYVGGVVGFNGEGGHSFKNITSNINVEGSTCDVGGLFGIAHYGNKFENCVCTGNVVITTEDAENALEMGGIAGVWHNGGADVTLTDCSFTGELSTPNVAGEVDFYYGGLVGCPYSATGNGKLIIGGYTYVASAAQLQAAVDAATGEITIKLGADINGDITVVQKAGVKITIEGLEKKYNGTIKVHSNSEHYSNAGLTIKDINFETSTILYNKDNEPYFNFIEALENGAERYSTNIKAENCSFTATGEAKNKAVGLQIKSSKWAIVSGCTADNMHSLIQAQSCDETVIVENCTINGKNGVAFKQVKSARVEGTTITALEYGIRFDGNTDNYGITLKDNEVTAVQPFIVRKMTGANNTIALEGTNTLTTEAEYQIVITNGSDDQEYVKPTGTYTLTGVEGFSIFGGLPVAKVGNTEYDNISEAIANWTNNTTLTLLANVTLSDVITLKSTEYHILDLGIYTMTAAKSKDAITITAEGRNSASYALDIKADATNPGGITATGKAIVKTTGKSGLKDRPIIRFYNGVFNANNIIQHSGSNGTNCPQFQFHNGVFNGSLSANRALIQCYGGTFNGRFYISVDSSAYALISGGKFKYLDNLYGSALNSDKFTIGSSKGNFDRGVYVDDEGYIVVGGSVITEFGDRFAAKATNVSKAGSYLPYSSAAEHGLYYTNAEAAIAKHGEANVVLK